MNDIEQVKAIQGTEHDFKQGESLQWASRGFSWNDAQTPYTCSTCGQSFIHFYHDEPNIFKAMAKAGIDPAICIKHL